MRLSVFSLALTFASSLAVALPQSSYQGCLSQDQANSIIAEYAAIQALAVSDLGPPRRTARALLASDFQETSDSLNELIGLPLGSVTFTNKHDYIVAVLNTTPVTIDTLKVLVSGCNYITWYWNIPEHNTLGFHLLEINSAGQIQEAWLEFNSIAYLESIGGSCSPAPTSKPRLMRL